MSALAGKQLGIEDLRDLFEITGPILKQFDFVAKLHYGYLILNVEHRDQTLCQFASGADVLEGIDFGSSVEQQDDVCRKMSDASDFLWPAILQDHQIVSRETRIEMDELVVGSDRQLYFFNHYSEAILSVHLVREWLADR